MGGEASRQAGWLLLLMLMLLVVLPQAGFLRDDSWQSRYLWQVALASVVGGDGSLIADVSHVAQVGL